MKKKLSLMMIAAFLLVSLFRLQNIQALSDSESSDWWDTDWHYRIKVKVYSGHLARDDEPVELTIDFAMLLSSRGISGNLDPNSIRIIDQSEAPREVLSQFDPISSEVIWLTGRMEADTVKTYFVYFDVLENGSKSPPGYYKTMEDGGILVLPQGSHVSVIYKIMGLEYEVARIDERNARICYLKPPYGNPLLDGEVSYLGFTTKDRVFSEDSSEKPRVNGSADVLITGGPVRYQIKFHKEPETFDDPVAFQAYGYTFYYVSNGHEARTRLNKTWVVSPGFTLPHPSRDWPEVFGIRAKNRSCFNTAFLATSVNAVSLFNVQNILGSMDGDEYISHDLLDNFWGASGKHGSISIIHLSPDYTHWNVVGYRNSHDWSWAAIQKSEVDYVEEGSYFWDFWIYGYDQTGWSSANDFGERIEEPILVEKSFNPISKRDAVFDRRNMAEISSEEEDSFFSNRENKTYLDDLEKLEFKIAWYGTGWKYRKKLTFDNSGQSENLIDFPVLVKLTPANFDYSHCESDGRDIRFVDSDDTTETIMVIAISG